MIFLPADPMQISSEAIQETIRCLDVMGVTHYLAAKGMTN